MPSGVLAWGFMMARTQNLGDTRTSGAIPPLLLTVLALVSAIEPLTINMYLSGMPQLSRDLGVDQTAGQLTLTAFLAGIAVGQIVVGPVSDSLGRRTLFIGGTLGLMAASALAAVAPNIWVLYLARVAQGLAGGTAVVLARAVAADLASGKELARVFALLMMLGSIAPVVGPILGGLIVDFVGWRGVFWLLALLNLLMWLGVWRFVPESLPAEKRRPFTLKAVRDAFTQLSKDRAFVGYSLGFMFSFVTMFAYVSASPYVLQEHYGFTPIQYAIIFAVNTTGLAILTIINRRIVGRTGPLILSRIFNLVQLAATIYLIAVTVMGLNRWFILVGLFVVVASNGVNLGNNSALAIDRAQGVTGTASAIMGAGQFMFAGIVSPVVGIVAGFGMSQPIAMAVVMFLACVVATIGIQWIGAGATRKLKA